MTASVEHEAKPSLPEGMTEVPETPEIPSHMESAGVTSVPTQFTQKVTDDTGQALTQSPSTQQVTITLPADPTTLVNWTKGTPASALTWLGLFWVRMVKKAAHFGWKVMAKRSSD
jgi:hypothetical protein